ncbi:MAG: rhodanese-like domain-containing protein, partial [Bacteroidia bacterium]|nr:rhodanese-like domain-containing protein [Bacteroidia bacterium]
NINFMGNSFREQINKMDKTKNYYVYCRSGMRSSSACRMMSKLGFKNLVNLSGGILAYKGKIV